MCSNSSRDLTTNLQPTNVGLCHSSHKKRPTLLPVTSSKRCLQCSKHDLSRLRRGSLKCSTFANGSSTMHPPCTCRSACIQERTIKSGALDTLASACVSFSFLYHMTPDSTCGMLNKTNTSNTGTHLSQNRVPSEGYYCKKTISHAKMTCILKNLWRWNSIRNRVANNAR